MSRRPRLPSSGQNPGDPTNLRAIYDRDGGLCWLCDLPIPWYDPRRAHRLTKDQQKLRPSRDHILERRFNGATTADNLRLAHQWCNSSRSGTQTHQQRARFIQGLLDRQEKPGGPSPVEPRGWRCRHALKSKLKPAKRLPTWRRGRHRHGHRRHR